MTTTTTKVDLTTLLDETAAVRFWDNIRIGGPDDCWPWVGDTGTREPTGHVRIWHQSVKVYAHRLAYLLAGGQIDDGEVVMHACDNGSCCNYLHLRVGTSADNTRDRDQKNRRTPFLPRGEAHWSAKLTDADALRIRAAKKLGLNAHHLAAMYGVSRSSIYNVWGGLHYPCLLPPTDEDDDPPDASDPAVAVRRTGSHTTCALSTGVAAAP